MWKQLFLVLPLILSTLAIKVPVDNDEENATDVAPTKTAANKQDTFYVANGAGIDSYLIPPDPHRPEEVLPDYIVTPATYLLPPSPEKQIDYYAPPEDSQQTDWYPIAQEPLPSTPILLPPRQSELIPIIIANNNQSFEYVQNPRKGKVYNTENVDYPLPARQLLPPLENAPNEYKIVVPSKDLELPAEEIDHEFETPLQEYPIPVLKPIRKLHPKKNNLRIKSVEPTLALHLTPPKPLATIYKNPTKLYPKKVAKGFQPIPIPLAQFAEEPAAVLRAKPVKPFNPVTNAENEYFTSPDEKKIYLYEQAEQKRKLKGENEAFKQQQLAVAAQDTYGDNAPAEPETSETNYRHPGRNVYPAPLRQAPPPAPAPVHATPVPGERTEFRMHGMKGPHSYQFGFDTGKGKNRQFRYEERDNDGRVKGHYGYVEKNGKLRVVNYNADPEHGFHAEAPQDAE